MEDKCYCKGKSLDRFLRPTILMLLFNNEMHGFSMLKAISASPLFNGEYPDPTGLYRYLKTMERNGLLSSREETQSHLPPKRVYMITEDGRLCLRNWAKTIHVHADRLAELAEQIDNTVRL